MVPTSKAFWHCRLQLIGRSLVIMESRVLVAHASRMRSAREIAEAIGAELSIAF
jgi:hypothetical protein